MNHLPCRTSTKYRYRFVCRNRSGTANGHSEKRNSSRKVSRKVNKRLDHEGPTGAEEEEKLLVVPQPCGHCRNKEAKYQTGRFVQTPPLNGGHRGKLSFKKKSLKKHSLFRNKSSLAAGLTCNSNGGGGPMLRSDMRPDDLPQVDGFCCGHAYLKLSDANGCVCLCAHCRAIDCERSRKGQERPKEAEDGNAAHNHDEEQQKNGEVAGAAAVVVANANNSGTNTVSTLVTSNGGLKDNKVSKPSI